MVVAVIIVALVVWFFNDANGIWNTIYFLLSAVTLGVVLFSKPKKKPKLLPDEMVIRAKIDAEKEARQKALTVVRQEEEVELKSQLPQRYGEDAAKALEQIKAGTPWVGEFYEDVVYSLGEPLENEGEILSFANLNSEGCIYPVAFQIGFAKDNSGNLKVSSIQTLQDLMEASHPASSLSGKQMIESLRGGQVWIGATFDDVLFICGKPDFTRSSNEIFYRDQEYEFSNLFSYSLAISFDSNGFVSRIRTLEEAVAEKHPNLDPDQVIELLKIKRPFEDATEEEILYMLGKPETVDSQGQWKYQNRGKKAGGYDWGTIIKFSRGRVKSIGGSKW